jgi:hypothetical protein
LPAPVTIATFPSNESSVVPMIFPWIISGAKYRNMKRRRQTGRFRAREDTVVPT